MSKIRRNKAGQIIVTDVIEGGKDHTVQPPKDYEVIEHPRVKHKWPNFGILFGCALWIFGIIDVLIWACTDVLSLWPPAIALGTWIAGALVIVVVKDDDDI